MEFQDFSRSRALNNIPDKKLQDQIKLIQQSNDERKNIKLIAVNRYAESNIPVEYWNLKMEKDFFGDPRLLKKYQEYIQDINNSYLSGSSICFAGNNGTGKTMTSCCILKKACEKGFMCLYSTLSDIVNILTQSSSEQKFISRRELNMIDFLVIDEFDPRFMATDNTIDLYARTLETVFRTRSQNKLPTIMCTNSPNIVECFNGQLKISLDSLIKGYLKMFPVFGEDARKR